MSWNRILCACIAVTALAGAQAPPFKILDGPIPRSVFYATAIGDLDGDGDADLLGWPGTAYVNDGNGRFMEVSVPSLSSVGFRGVLADFDGNGLPDILSIENTLSQQLRLDLQVGALTFTPTPLPVLTVPSPYYGVGNMAVADVDLDGDVDILIEATYTGSFVGLLQLWLNDGSALFSPAPASQFPSGNFSRTHLIFRDLDNNGYPDAIFAGISSLSIQVALNIGGVLTLAPAMQWNLGTQLTALDVGDFNGDGWPDIAFGTKSPPSGILIAGIIMNSPSGFLPPVVTPGLAPGVMRAVDVTGDGMDELLFQSSWNGSTPGLSLHAITPGATIDPAIQSWPTLRLLAPGGAPPPYGIAGPGSQPAPGLYGGAPTGAESVHDLDGDNDRDVFVTDFVLSGYSGLAVPGVLMNDGVSGFVSIGGHSHGVGIRRPQIADVNGDGHPDVLDFAETGPATLLMGLNDGEGNFSPGPSTVVSVPYWSSNQSSYPYYSPCLFDRDGDGDSDIYLATTPYAIAFSSTTPYDIVLDNAGGTFTPVATVSGTGYASAIKAADLDGDGDQDILLGHGVYAGSGAPPPMSLVLNLGAAGFAAPTPIGTSHTTYNLEVGDFDGNGTVDVFAGSVLYLNTGGATFTAVPQTFGGVYTAAGDLNNDGMIDLVVDWRVYFNGGGGTFIAGPTLPPNPANGGPDYLVNPAVLVDVDLDGDLDLVETPARVSLNLGGGTFAPWNAILPKLGYNPTFADPKSAVVDLDHDGDPDIVAPGPIIVTNVMRQIARGSLARPGRPASIDLYGTPAASWMLYASNGTAFFPLPPFGNVLIHPASAFLVATGTFNPSPGPDPGTASISAIVPNDPALVGWTSFWQAVDMTALATTNRLTITVQAY